jgi:hypothetical protein
VSKNNYDPHPIGLEMFEAMGYTVDGKDGPRQTALENMQEELAEQVDYIEALSLYLTFIQGGLREYRSRDKVYAQEYLDEDGNYQWQILREENNS